MSFTSGQSLAMMENQQESRWEPSGHEEVVAEGALVDAADGADGGLGALVGYVGLEADAEQVEGFEGRR